MSDSRQGGPARTPRRAAARWPAPLARPPDTPGRARGIVLE
ncbi:hypothetical protein JOD64_005014 [Micromonospora luteifusca]|uniref:Uncharacterized protein n=1 Tax=Micromonospora luteifusca TaxID=709860 RepID=A0ABS2M0T0_9ACTN|nr:hypothetical protein [Micromonospora luteifusca]MBM7493792.1 hypothetical protein [Micromonospora luteifusca]